MDSTIFQQDNKENKGHLKGKVKKKIAPGVTFMIGLFRYSTVMRRRKPDVIAEKFSWISVERKEQNK